MASLPHNIQRVATNLVQANPPPGFFAATATVASQAPGISQIRRGSLDHYQWHHHEAENSLAVLEQSSSKHASSVRNDVGHHNVPESTDPSGKSTDSASKSWITTTKTTLLALWKWFCTPFGFFLTIYGLNVVAWGGMLFLLLCNASRAMCWSPIHTPGTTGHFSPAAALALHKKYPRYYNCNDINSPRRVWIEIDSQILNALFCVTGYGLIPWRFRDLWYLLRWRLTSERRYGVERRMYGLRMLAGIYCTWVRLPGSDTLDFTHDSSNRLIKPGEAASPSEVFEIVDTEAGFCTNDIRLPLPLSKAPVDPISGNRAPPTATWKIDFFVWSQVLNTFLQACLCGFMWGMNRYNRPSWATGLFIGLACIIAGLGGLVSYLEGKKVKKIEGVASKDEGP